MSGTTKDGWRNTIFAGLGIYIDAGPMVACSAALAPCKDSSQAAISISSF